MTYVYDILINLNDHDYKFYEWEETDDIEYLKKGVLLKVSDYIYKKLLSNNIVVGNKLLETIKDKTCVLKNKRVENITYMSLFTNGKDVIGLTFSKEGNIFEMTRLTIQDEVEILEMSRDLKYTKVDYKKISNHKYNISFISRKEKNDIKHILNGLSRIKEEKEKIEYLYFEWFGKKSEINCAYTELINDIKNNYNESRISFMNLLDLVSIKNNV